MPALNPCDYAVIRVVPRVDRGEFINAGVVLFCRPLRYLQAEIALDRYRLAAFAPTLSPELVESHLAAIPQICAGGPIGGPIGALPLQERFHWLVAPRSTLIQTSPVHTAITDDPATLLHALVSLLVRVL